MAEMTKNWVNRMIARHADVVVEIGKVKKHVDSAIGNPQVSKVTVANLSLLLRDLKNIEKDYRTMLESENVTFTMSGEYFAKIGQINGKKDSDNND